MNVLRLPSVKLSFLLRWEGERFVTATYDNVLGRKPDPEGLAHHLEMLSEGVSKLEIIRRIRFSEEGCSADVKVEGLRVRLVLHRLSNLPVIGGLFNSSNGSFDDLSEEISGGRSLVSAPVDLRHLLHLNGQRFINAVYIKILGRQPDDDGLLHHLGLLLEGVTKLEIIRKIRFSEEGRQSGVTIDHLDTLLTRESIGQLPLFGWTFSVANKIFNFVPGEVSINDRIFLGVEITALQLKDMQRQIDRLQDQVLQLQIKNNQLPSSNAKLDAAMHATNSKNLMTDARASRFAQLDMAISSLRELLAHQSRSMIEASRNAIAPLVEAPTVPSNEEFPGENQFDQRLTDLDLVISSQLFDEDWYVNEYGDNLCLGISPAEHYLTVGWRDGHNPSLSFDGNWYLKYYPDIFHSGAAPLVHYLRDGEREGRETKFVEGAHTRLAGKKETGYLVIEPLQDRYATWRAINQDSDAEESRLIAALAVSTAELPVISVVMPVYRPPLNLLDEAVESVFCQVYGKWELCVYVDGEASIELRAQLNGYAARDSRVKVRFGTRNAGISVATNEASKLANGEYIAFLDQDDILRKSALAEFALAAEGDSEVDILYSDDDKLDELEQFKAPQFKPGWAPILLLSYMYISHLFVVRRSMFERLSGFRVGYEGSQDYDFALRASEVARKVVHIPKILYHWRVLAGSTAASADAKPASMGAGLKAVQDACDRREIDAIAYQAEWAVAAKVGMFSLRFPEFGPRVTIIIPTKNHLELLAPCIHSIEELTKYKNYDILVVDNDSDEPETVEYLLNCPHRVIRVSSPNGKFNFAHLINQAVKACDSDYVLFLNNDTEVRRADWLQQMVGYAQMSKVGAVGAKLYFPDNSIQHAGIIHGLYGGLAGPVLRNAPSYHHGYLGYAVVAREYSAVTAACLLTPRSLFLEVGGMNQKEFGVAYNDVDFCYRLVKKGYSCVFCPDAELTHFEGKSRGFKDNPLEIAAFRQRYRSFVDPWYNKNLSLEDENFQIRPWRYVPQRSSSQPVRLVMVSHNLNHEGAPNSMLEMVRGLSERGVITPVVVSPEDGPLRRSYEDAGIEVQIIDHPLLGAFGGGIYARNRRALADTWRLAGAEMVYANTADAFWAIDAAREAGLPAVWNIRESEPWSDYFDDLPMHIRKCAYGAFSYPYRTIFVAQSTRDGWSPLNTRHNFTVIHNGLDLQKIQTKTSAITRASARAALNVKSDEVAVILVGTICERKNQKVLINAFSRMSSDITNRMQIFLVGDRESDYSTELHVLRARLPAAKRARVTIIPETDQPYLYYLAGDIAVCSSRLESYPRVVLEAMALGLPIIATPVFGIVEQVREDVNASLFSPDDDEKLAAALNRLVANDQIRQSMGRNSELLFRGLIQYDEMLTSYGDIMREACLSSPPMPRLMETVCAA